MSGERAANEGFMDRVKDFFSGDDAGKDPHGRDLNEQAEENDLRTDPDRTDDVERDALVDRDPVGDRDRDAAIEDHPASDDDIAARRAEDVGYDEPVSEDHYQNEDSDTWRDRDSDTRQDRDSDTWQDRDSDTWQDDAQRRDATHPGEDGLGAHDAVGAGEAEEHQVGESSTSRADELTDESRGNEVFDDQAAAGEGASGAGAAGAAGATAGAGAAAGDRRGDDYEGSHRASEDPLAEDAWDGSGDVPDQEVPHSDAVDRHAREHGDGSDRDLGREHDRDQTNVDDVSVDEGSVEEGSTNEDFASQERAEMDAEVSDELRDDAADAEADEAVHDAAAPSEDAERAAAEADDAAFEREGGAGANDGADDGAAVRGDDALAESDEDKAARAEEFAAEHDPANHDVTAGEEFRQRGDWAAGDDGPQVQEADGTIHEAGSDEAAERAGQSGDHGDQGHGDHGDHGGEGGVRESTVEEIRDGGHGVGSAAPIEGGVQPLGHPVKAWHDTCTYVLPGEEGYSADPHEWFADPETAERAGFRHAHGG